MICQEEEHSLQVPAVEEPAESESPYSYMSEGRPKPSKANNVKSQGLREIRLGSVPHIAVEPPQPGGVGAAPGTPPGTAHAPILFFRLESQASRSTCVGFMKTVLCSHGPGGQCPHGGLCNRLTPKAALSAWVEALKDRL